jgi:hypothetical protein
MARKRASEFTQEQLGSPVPPANPDPPANPAPLPTVLRYRDPIDMQALLAVAERLASQMASFVCWARPHARVTPGRGISVDEFVDGFARWSACGFSALAAEEILAPPHRDDGPVNPQVGGRVSPTVRGFCGWLQTGRQGNLARWGDQMPHGALWNLTPINAMQQLEVVENALACHQSIIDNLRIEAGDQTDNPPAWSGIMSVNEMARAFGIGRKAMAARIKDGTVRTKYINRQSYQVDARDLPCSR